MFCKGQALLFIFLILYHKRFTVYLVSGATGDLFAAFSHRSDGGGQGAESAVRWHAAVWSEYLLLWTLCVGVQRAEGQESGGRVSGNPQQPLPLPQHWKVSFCPSFPLTLILLLFIFFLSNIFGFWVKLSQFWTVDCRSSRKSLDYTKQSLRISIDLGKREEESETWLQVGRIYYLIQEDELADMYLQVRRKGYMAVCRVEGGEHFSVTVFSFFLVYPYTKLAFIVCRHSSFLSSITDSGFITSSCAASTSVSALFF